MTSFNGLYYPGESWGLPDEDTVLKKSLLFFDKIYAIIPEVFSVEWQDVQPYEEIRDPLLRRNRPMQEGVLARAKLERMSLDHPSQHELERTERILGFMDKIQILRRQKVMELVNPRENLLDPPYWKFNENEDRPLYSAYPWTYIHEDYMSVVGQGCSIEDMEQYKPHILYGSILSDLKSDEFRSIANRLGSGRVIVYKGQAETNWLEQLGRASGYSEDKWEPFPSAVHYYGFPGTVSTAVWASLVVNHSLMTAHRYDLVPVSSNPIFDDLLQSKIRRIRNLAQATDTRFDEPEYKGAFTGISLAICALPDLELTGFEDVVSMRCNLKDELEAFRQEMYKLSELVQAYPWNTDFRQYVDYVNEHNIKPVLRQLQDKIDSGKNSAALKALKAAMIPSTVAVMANIWPGVPAIVAMAVASGLVAVETAATYYVERRNALRSNGLSLLLTIQ